MSLILGLDLGTNSIGWALFNNNLNEFVAAGSRILPADAGLINQYQSGSQLETPTKNRRIKRVARRLNERAKLRRSRLLRVLNILGWLPPHFASQIDFVARKGQFLDGAEPLLPYSKDSNNLNKFLFEEAFNEMLSDFRNANPTAIAAGKKIPHDWTLYYLRDKALSKPLSKEELAWVLLNFNTKRGYYQLSENEGNQDAENVETENSSQRKEEEFCRLKVEKVEKQDRDNKRPDRSWYELTYEGGRTQKILSAVEPCKPGDIREAIVTTKFGKDGLPKEEKVSTPNSLDWKLLKKRSETDIENAHLTAGSFIYRALLNQPDVKIRGKLVRTIERSFYVDELKAILEKQAEFHPEFADRDILETCVNELYPSNEHHRSSLRKKDLSTLFIEDILFYQRPLKSKKGLIDKCPLEQRTYRDPSTGELVTEGIQCIPRSNPLFAEFRLWQFVNNLKIYQRYGEKDGLLTTDVDVTLDFLSDAKKRCELFNWIRPKKSIDQKDLLASPVFDLPAKQRAGYRWNYPEDKTFPVNPTLYELSRRSRKGGVSAPLSDDEVQHLWHILYSVSDPIQRRKALGKFGEAHGADGETFSKAFRAFVPEPGYGSFSEKAIRKLLVPMGEGKQQWEASYEVYGRHSEASDLTRWETPDDIDAFLGKTRQYSLRNPVVEQVVMETLRVVRDIWKAYGRPDEIHIELARDLRQNAEERKKTAKRQSENEARNLRIKRLLEEFARPEAKIENVRPASPIQQDLLKIYEDGAINDSSLKDRADYKEVLAISQRLGNARTSDKVSSSEIKRYRLWLEQHYLSPYTGAVIPLNRLFTPDYEIEHVIPRARYFDDSLSNRVICEAAVNKLKDAMLGLQFIKEKGGSTVELGGGRTVKVLSVQDYEQFVKEHYASNRSKMKKLLMEEIPDDFSERQLNDTRYMTRQLLSILSPLVREKEGDIAATSKNIIATSGSITDRLKKDWGLNDVWNDIVAWRFKRLNDEITHTNNYGEEVERDGKRFFRCDVPKELQAGFNKKRIDHRHHALDAMVIACTTRSMVNFLNNANAAPSKEEERKDLRNKLCQKVKTDSQGNYVYRFIKPYENFTADVRHQLENLTVSIKRNLRTLTRKDGSMVMRRPLHKESVFGCRMERVGKKQQALAVIRKPLVGLEPKNIVKVHGNDVRKILQAHLDAYPDKAGAFTAEAVEQMNANIAMLNGGKAHKPVFSVKLKETLGEKFPVGSQDNRAKKFVEAEKGTNLFSAIYENSKGERSAVTIPYREVVECRKSGLPLAPEFHPKKGKLIMILAVGDIVRMADDTSSSPMLYRMVRCTAGEIYFLPLSVARIIHDKVEFTSKNEMQQALDNRMIKTNCVKVTVDRLGRVTPSPAVPPSPLTLFPD